MGVSFRAQILTDTLFFSPVGKARKSLSQNKKACMYELISVRKMCPEQAATLKQKAGESRVEDIQVQMARNTTEWIFWKQNWQEKVIKLLLAAKNHEEGKQNSS